jgi:hypothetical protein
MLEWLAGLALALALLWAVAVLHQLGHYVTGRRIVEIPASEMRIVSPFVPRYLALRKDDAWVPPYEFDRYRDCYEQHDSGYEHLERYVAGGELIQTLVVVPIAVVLALAGFRIVAAVLLASSIAVTFAYVAVDTVVTWRTESLSGDYSALWYVSKRVPVLLMIAFLFVHLGAFYFVV